MYRLARARQPLRLESVIGVRSYSAAAPETQAQTERPIRSDGGPQSQRMPNVVKLDAAKAYTARVDSTEDSLAGTLLRQTKAGHAAQAMSNRIGEMAAKRRALRLEKEAQRSQEAPARHGQAQAVTQPTSNHGASSAPVRDRTSQFRRNRGQDRTGGAPGNRPDNRNFRSKSRNLPAPPRVSTVNFAPRRTTEAEDNSADLSAEDLNDHVEAPNYPGPLAVSSDLRNVFQKLAASNLDVALSHVPPSGPSSLKAAKGILTRFGGDYSAYTPQRHQGLYTTPIQNLPVRTQLELALAKSKDISVPSRQYLTRVVSKAIGEVPAGTVV